MSKELSRSLLLNTLWSFIGRFGYLTVGLITNIILARLLSPKEFGQLGIIMFFIIIGNVLTESGLSGALVRKKNVTDIDYSTIFIFNLIISLVLMAILIASSGFVAEFYSDSELKSLLIVSSFVLLINAFKITQSTRLTKELQFKKKAAYEFIAIFIASIITVFLAIKGAGVWALISFQLLIAIISTLLLWFFVGPLKSYRFSTVSFKSFYKFGVNTTFASLLNTGFDNIYQLVLGKYFSIAQSGYFYQAKNLQGIPLNLIVMLGSGPIYSVLSRLQDSPKDFNKMYENITRVFTIIVGFLSIIIFFYAEVIISILYGADWIESAYYMQLLIIGSFFYTQEMFNRNIFKIFDRTEKILQLEILKKAIQLGTIFYGVLTMSIENLLYGFIITSIISFFINYYFARKLQGNNILDEAFIILKVIFISIIVVLISHYFALKMGLDSFNLLWLLPFIFISYILLLHFSRVISIFNDSKSLYYIIKNKK
ncbi:lipopolysaccharide biosynthesis protein [Psychrobacter celer]|uniref:lipopolysaccharide biosynthesis protein n=1 Tax=Psychrobacter celer TaxID=306572 RepID=UPI003FD62096